MERWILGIDISKAYFDVYLSDGKASTSGQFANEASGFKKLSKWLQQRQVKTVHACLEGVCFKWVESKN